MLLAQDIIVDQNKNEIELQRFSKNSAEGACSIPRDPAPKVEENSLRKGG
jgi:hypothetical protein